jgi:hypothetical protein
MGISTCVPSQAKADFLSGVHTLKDQYKVVFYDGTADLGPDTLVYELSGEVTGKGYRPGGLPLSNPRVWIDRGAGCLTFDDMTIKVATLTVRGFTIINASKGNKVIFVGDYGQEYTSTEGPFHFRVATDLITYD